MNFLNTIGNASLIIGIFFCISGAVGLIRMPDLYTRVHGAAILDSLGMAFILLGLACRTEVNMVLIKIVLTFLFLLFTGPATVHALAKSALHGGLKPRVEEDKKSIS